MNIKRFNSSEDTVLKYIINFNKVNKQVLILNVHSFIDLITNSSTELFIIDNNEITINSVTEMLKLMLDHWNQMAAKGVFGEYYKINDRFNFKKDKKSKVIKTFEDTFDNVFIFTKEMYEESKKHKYSAEYENKENIGKIIITGVFDNSIPSEMFDWIESAFGFNTQRFHLG